MLNLSQRHKALDYQAVTQFMSLNQSAAAMWEHAGRSARDKEVAALFHTTAMAMERVASELKELLPRVAD